MDGIPTPERAVDKPFLMPVEDIFTITGRGTVATGRIERGIIKVGEGIEIVGIRDTQTTTVTGVEMFRKLLDEGQAGDNAGILLGGVKRDEVERGQVLAKPKSITPHKLMCSAYILKGRGRSPQALLQRVPPAFYFRTTDVTGSIKLPEGTEMVMPGDNIEMDVELITPVAMEKELASPSVVVAPSAPASWSISSSDLPSGGACASSVVHTDRRRAVVALLCVCNDHLLAVRGAVGYKPALACARGAETVMKNQRYIILSFLGAAVLGMSVQGPSSVPSSLARTSRTRSCWVSSTPPPSQD